jgi:hypothetical protein
MTDDYGSIVFFDGDELLHRDQESGRRDQAERP